MSSIAKKLPQFVCIINERLVFTLYKLYRNVTVHVTAGFHTLLGFKCEWLCHTSIRNGKTVGYIRDEIYIHDL